MNQKLKNQGYGETARFDGSLLHRASKHTARQQQTGLDMSWYRVNVKEEGG